MATSTNMKVISNQRFNARGKPVRFHHELKADYLSTFNFLGPANREKPLLPVGLWCIGRGGKRGFAKESEVKPPREPGKHPITHDFERGLKYKSGVCYGCKVQVQGCR